MPYESSGSPTTMWYSFDVGLVHFVAIDTETSYPNAPEGELSFWHAGPFGNQLEWLENDITKADANRAAVPWVVVIGHRPMYSSCPDDFPPRARSVCVRCTPILLCFCC